MSVSSFCTRNSVIRFSFVVLFAQLSGWVAAQDWKRVYSADSVLSLEVRPSFKKAMETPFELFLADSSSTLWVVQGHVSQREERFDYVRQMMDQPRFNYTRLNDSVAYAENNYRAEQEKMWVVAREVAHDQLIFMMYGGHEMTQAEALHTAQSLRVNAAKKSVIRYLSKEYVWYEELGLALKSDILLFPIEKERITERYDSNLAQQKLVACYAYQNNSSPKVICTVMRFELAEDFKRSLDNHAAHYKKHNYDIHWGTVDGQKALLLKKVVGSKEDPMGTAQLYFVHGQSLYKVTVYTGVHRIDDFFHSFVDGIKTNITNL